MMECPDQKTLLNLAANGLSAESAELCAAHIENCLTCQERLDRLFDDVIPDSQSQPEQYTLDVKAIQRLQETVTAAAHARPTESGHKIAHLLAPAESTEYIGRFDHYDVIEVAGEGGMGVVFRAMDLSLQREVALKVLPPSTLSNQVACERFIREARVGGSLDHQNIVTVYSVNERHHPPYLTMQYVDGESLQDCISRRGRLEVEDVIRVGVDVADGLAAAHKKHLVHRDLKPANILIEESTGRAKIADFGLAQAVDDARLTQSGTVVGTPEYLAPERVDGLEGDHRSDLFALGVLLFTASTGSPPFRGANSIDVLRSITTDPTPNLSSIRPELPSALVDVIESLLRKDPDARLSTAEEVGIRLRTSSHTVPASPKQSRLIGLGILAVAVVLLVMVSISLFNQQDPPPPQLPSKPFSVSGINESFDSLMMAIMKANSGDVITITDDGPFDMMPQNIGEKSLTIQAAQSCKPILVGIRGDQPLIQAQGSLHLSGLEFRWRGDDTNDLRKPETIEELLRGFAIQVLEGELHLINCRLITAGGGGIGLEKSSCHIMSSHLLTPETPCVRWWPRNTDELNIVNSILTGSAAVEFLPDLSSGTERPQLSLVSSVVDCARVIGFHIPRVRAMRQLRQRGGESLNVDSRENVMKTSSILDWMCRIDTNRFEGMSSAEKNKFIQSFFAWREADNCYHEGLHIVTYTESDTELQEVNENLSSVALWLRLWNLDMDAFTMMEGEFDDSYPKTDPRHYRTELSGVGARVTEVGPGEFAPTQ